jgi:molybdopterin biosynthesis enzyme
VTSLTPLDEALTLWLAPLVPVTPEQVPLAEAVGHVLAEPLRAGHDVPATAIARREGYGVRALETIGASPYSPVLCRESPRLVRAGDPLAPGCDAVLPAGAVLTGGPMPEILAEAVPGEDVRRAGEDVRAGAVLREAGETVRALDAAIARAAGIAACVVRRPVVCITTGDPLGEFAADRAALAGARVVRAGPADAVIAPADGVESIRGPLALRPGEPLVLGRRDGRPALGLPDALDDALGGILVILPALIARLAGTQVPPPDRSGRLARKLTSRIGLAEIALVRRTPEGLEPLASGDLPLARFTRAEGWLLIPPDAEGYAPGETVAYSAL